ncbi:hypothetical protein HOH87_03745 [bacterium]|jgi:hypothetical protein|nr:hypothetical protein [bacterium]
MNLNTTPSINRDAMNEYKDTMLAISKRNETAKAHSQNQLNIMGQSRALLNNEPIPQPLAGQLPPTTPKNNPVRSETPANVPTLAEAEAQKIEVKPAIGLSPNTVAIALTPTPHISPLPLPTLPAFYNRDNGRFDLLPIYESLTPKTAASLYEQVINEIQLNSLYKNNDAPVDHKTALTELKQLCEKEPLLRNNPNLTKLHNEGESLLNRQPSQPSTEPYINSFNNFVSELKKESKKQERGYAKGQVALLLQSCIETYNQDKLSKADITTIEYTLRDQVFSPYFPMAGGKPTFIENLHHKLNFLTN